ncbi:MAG TPA: site-specific integrase [Porphyromonadaceae bacterium]|nr:site-specific integrase [Porphyromonadaceae bacterium]
MASIVARGKRFSVVYKVNGEQKWESFKTRAEAESRKKEIEYKHDIGTFVPPNPMTVEDFLKEYVEVYGLTKWGHSAYKSNNGLIRNYVNPIIGSWKLKDLTTKRMDRYFANLKDQPAVQQTGRGDPGFISDRNIHDINQLLSNAFDKAVEWEYVGKNPVTHNACPSRENRPREIWDPDTAKKALTLCDELNLLVCMHLSIPCSLRIGEIVGLRWALVSLGDDENGFEDATLKVDVQLQRISKDVYEKLKRKQDQIKLIFPGFKETSKSMLVLKKLKTKNSERVMWIPATTAAILWKLKKQQEELKSLIGDEYQDFDMVIAQTNGRPIEGGSIDEMFAKFIEANKLPKVEFHSLRHLSTTVKLLISKGDIKTVQGATGHSQAKMVTDTYAHILDKNRQSIAKKFEQSFYGNDEGDGTPELSVEQLIAMCAKNPDALETLRNLLTAKTV